MQNLEQKVSSIDKINEKLTNLILELQTEVKNLKEDTICNAQHLQMLKEKNNDINHKIISAQNNQLKSTMSFVNDLQKENEANGTNNYADFIKGFNNKKTIPSVFLYENINKKSKESILNTHLKKDGNYDVLVIHKTAQKILLRSGDKLVGIFNNGYAKNPLDKTYNTINRSVEREIIKDE